jgi:hypothetical protein
MRPKTSSQQNRGKLEERPRRTRAEWEHLLGKMERVGNQEVTNGRKQQRKGLQKQRVDRHGQYLLTRQPKLTI